MTHTWDGHEETVPRALRVLQHIPAGEAPPTPLGRHTLLQRSNSEARRAGERLASVAWTPQDIDMDAPEWGLTTREWCKVALVVFALVVLPLCVLVGVVLAPLWPG